jgi:hypothetical protein
LKDSAAQANSRIHLSQKASRTSSHRTAPSADATHASTALVDRRTPICPPFLISAIRGAQPPVFASDKLNGWTSPTCPRPSFAEGWIRNAGVELGAHIRIQAKWTYLVMGHSGVIHAPVVPRTARTRRPEDAGSIHGLQSLDGTRGLRRSGGACSTAHNLRRRFRSTTTESYRIVL